MAKQLTENECKKVIFCFDDQNNSEKKCFQLFRQFDNGNRILSLAEVDRAVIYWHPEFGTSRQAIIRAFRAADTNGVRFFLCFTRSN